MKLTEEFEKWMNEKFPNNHNTSNLKLVARDLGKHVRYEITSTQEMWEAFNQGHHVSYDDKLLSVAVQSGNLLLEIRDLLKREPDEIEEINWSRIDSAGDNHIFAAQLNLIGRLLVEIRDKL